MKDIMIDLETLSLRPNAAILTIAAVAFDIRTGEIGERLHLGVVPYAYGYDHVDSAVVDWWCKQSASARSSLRHMLEDSPYRLDFALEKLNRLIERNLKVGGGVWSNGASFDLPILTSAYRHYDITTAWPFWQERDTRTIVNIAEQLTGIKVTKTTAFEGEKHTALADALFQARYVSQAFQLLAGRNVA